MSNAGNLKARRGEMLTCLRSIYPSSLQVKKLHRILIPVFPEIEAAHMRQDLTYLIAKGYIERRMPHDHESPETIPWENRYMCLTATGVEIADKIREDPALDV